MEMRSVPIEVSINGAYTRVGIPLRVRAITITRISSNPKVVMNAVERFLGVDRARIMAVAKETLEGNLRGVLATLTPEEVNADKIKFAQSLLTEAEEDLRHIGLELDTLKIQDVSDDVNYLDSIGRKQSAEVQKHAAIAEARNKADSAMQSAQNHQTTEISRLDAQLGTLRADMARRVTDAQTKGVAMVAEAKGQVASKLARARAELDVQGARVEQVRRQLQADVLEPARAQKAAAEATAKGEAARIVEQGRATAAAMQEIATTWRRVGDNARQVFLMQKVDGLMRIVMSSAGDLKVDRLTVLGGIGGNGHERAAESRNWPGHRACRTRPLGGKVGAAAGAGGDVGGLVHRLHPARRAAQAPGAAMAVLCRSQRTSSTSSSIWASPSSRRPWPPRVLPRIGRPASCATDPKRRPNCSTRRPRRPPRPQTASGG
jgi:flotillin